MVKVVTLGGTGFIGRAVLRAVAARGAASEIAVVSRSRSFEDILRSLVGTPPPAGALSAEGARTPGGGGGQARVLARVIACDLVENGPSSELTTALREADLVTYSIQFPGHPVENTRKGYSYARYDVGGLRRVLEGPLADKATRVIYLSGAGAGQGRGEPWFRAKDAAEEALASWARRTGGSYVSLRPSVVVGREDVSVNRIFDAARLTHVCPLFGRGDVGLHPIWVEDLARTVVEFGLGAHAGVQGAFNLPGPEETTFRSLLETMFRVAGVRVAFLPVPIGLAKAGASLLSFLPSPPLTPAAIDFLTAGPAMPLPEGGPARAALDALRSGFSRPEKAFETYLRGR